MERYNFTLELPCFMCDNRDLMRPVAFMELAQEAAGNAAIERNFGDKDLEPIGAVWVLARQHVRFIKRPHWMDKVKMQTWHKGMKGVQFIRDYELLDEDGNPAVVSTSSWLVMSVADRKLVRGDVLEDFVPPVAEYPADAIETSCPKIVVPAGVEMTLAKEHVVQYSDLDHNQHTNNTKYILWSTDVIPQEVTMHRELREYFINFNKESKPGEKVLLYYGTNGTDYYVEGKLEDNTQVFITKTVYGE